MCSTHATSRYKILSKSFFITDDLTVIPTFNYSSSLYRPKFFPNDYQIKFQTQRAYLDFVEKSVVIRTKNRASCFEFILYQGKVVVEKRFLRSDYCLEDTNGSELTCSILQASSHLASNKYRIEFIENDGFFYSCSVSVFYEGRRIKLFHAEKLTPGTQENSGIRDKWYILSDGNLVSTKKLQFSQIYYKEKLGVYFESESAEEIFFKTAQIHFTQKSAWPSSPLCFREIDYLGYQSKTQVDDSLCLDFNY